MFRKLKFKIAFYVTIACVAIMCLTSYFVYSNSIHFQKESIEKNIGFVMDIDINTYATQINQMSNSTIFLYQKGDVTPYTEQKQYSEETFQKIFDKIIDMGVQSGKIYVDGKYIAFNSQRVFYSDDNRTGIYDEYVLYDYTELKNFSLSLVDYIFISGFIGLIIFACLGLLVSEFFVKPLKKAYNKEKRVVADISHELKTPLAVIMTDLDVMKNNKNQTIESQEKWISSIEDQSTKMNLLIKEMLTLSKLDNKNPQDISEFNISSLLEETILMLESYAYEQGISFQYNIEPDIKYKGSAADIAKLFSILMDNAIKYNKKNGKVVMNLYTSHSRIVFKIRNDGEGIDADKINSVFDRFYREDESRTSSKQMSFGLGLSIAKSIIDCAKGKISVESKKGEYTEFKVIL